MSHFIQYLFPLYTIIILNKFFLHSPCSRDHDARVRKRRHTQAPALPKWGADVQLGGVNNTIKIESGKYYY